MNAFLFLSYPSFCLTQTFFCFFLPFPRLSSHLSLTVLRSNIRNILMLDISRKYWLFQDIQKFTLISKFIKKHTAKGFEFDTILLLTQADLQ